MAKPRGFFTDFDVFYDFVCCDVESHASAPAGTTVGATSAGIGAGIGAVLGGPIGAALGAGLGGAGAWMLARTWIQDDDDDDVVQRKKFKRKFRALLRKRETGECSPREHRKAVKELAEDLEEAMYFY